MGKRLSVNEFLDMEGVIIDVRSESEFAKGHILGAVNLPLFNDAERAEVGTLYIRRSREVAIERGLEIVGPKMVEFVRKAKQISDNKTIKLYCWRGGMRSGSMQWLFDTAGLKTAILIGGYKSYRAEFERLLNLDWKFQVIAGETGSGKSEILHQLEKLGEQMLDLEGLANHKGSVFGALGQNAQPTTEEFINKIFHQMRCFDVAKKVWVEGESMLIGHVFVPPTLFKMLSEAPMLHFTLNRDRRLDRIMAEYGDFEIDDLKIAFEKIKKRLGYDNYKFALDALEAGDVRRAADIALVYYDKGYEKSIEKRSSTVVTEYYAENDDIIDNTLKIRELCK